MRGGVHTIRVREAGSARERAARQTPSIATRPRPSYTRTGVVPDPCELFGAGRAGGSARAPRAASAGPSGSNCRSRRCPPSASGFARGSCVCSASRPSGTCSSAGPSLRATAPRGRDRQPASGRGGHDRGHDRPVERAPAAVAVSASSAARSPTPRANHRQLVQPAVARRPAAPGAAVRLRGRRSRYGFEVRAYDLGEARATADFAPVYRASEQVRSNRLRELVRVGARRATPHDVLDPLPADLTLRRPGAPDSPRRARCDPLSLRPRRGRGRPSRLAFDELVALQLAVTRSRIRTARAAHCRHRGRCRPLPRRTALRTDRRPGARVRRDRRRSRASDADAAAAPGRRRLRQDRRRALRALARGRGRTRRLR